MVSHSNPMVFHVTLTQSYASESDAHSADPSVHKRIPTRSEIYSRQALNISPSVQFLFFFRIQNQYCLDMYDGGMPSSFLEFRAYKPRSAQGGDFYFTVIGVGPNCQDFPRTIFVCAGVSMCRAMRVIVKPVTINKKK